MIVGLQKAKISESAFFTFNYHIKTYTKIGYNLKIKQHIKLQ